jgi:hypothetical protein
MGTVRRPCILFDGEYAARADQIPEIVREFRTGFGRDGPERLRLVYMTGLGGVSPDDLRARLGAIAAAGEPVAGYALYHAGYLTPGGEFTHDIGPRVGPADAHWDAARRANTGTEGRSGQRQ